MLCKMKTWLPGFLGYSYLCLRTVLHLLIIDHCELWFYEDVHPSTIWCIVLGLLCIAFLWIDYFLIDYLHQKELFSKRFLNVIVAGDIFFYIIQFSTHFFMMLFCVLTESGYWSWRFDFVSGIILSLLFKSQLIATKYLLVKKHLHKSYQQTDKLQMAFACIPVVNWSNYFLRRFCERNVESRKEITKKDLLIFGCSITMGIILSLILIFIGAILPGDHVVFTMGTGIFFLPFGMPMIADLLMVQLSQSTRGQGDGLREPF